VFCQELGISTETTGSVGITAFHILEVPGSDPAKKRIIILKGFVVFLALPALKGSGISLAERPSM
jgi:hypothetical protein